MHRALQCLDSYYSHHMAAGLLEQSSPQLTGGDGLRGWSRHLPRESRWSRADGRAGRAESGAAGTSLQPGCRVGGGEGGHGVLAWPAFCTRFLGLRRENTTSRLEGSRGARCSPGPGPGQGSLTSGSICKVQASEGKHHGLPEVALGGRGVGGGDKSGPRASRTDVSWGGWEDRDLLCWHSALPPDGRAHPWAGAISVQTGGNAPRK